MRLTLFLLLILLSSSSFATDYFWIGGNGNWNDLNHWATTSGGTITHTALPDINDNVFFDANSFNSTGNTITLTSSSIAYCANFSWSFNGATLNGASTADLKIGGSITLASGMSVLMAGDLLLEATGTESITTNGATIDAKFFINSGTWNLADNFINQDNLSLAGGTFNSNGFNLQLNDLAVNGTVSKTLNLSNSTINLDDDFAVSFFHANTNFIATNSTINLNGPASIIQNATGFVFNNVNFTNTTQTAAGISPTTSIASFNQLQYFGGGDISGSNTISTLVLSPGFTYKFEAGETQNITNFIALGNCNAISTLISAASGVQSNIIANTTSLGFAQVKDLAASGTGSFNLNNGTDLGNNTGWNFISSAARNLFWIGGSGDWSDENHWALSSGGTGPTCPPTAVDNVFFDANSFTSSSKTVNLDNISYCNNMTWSGVVTTATLDGATPNELNIYGSLEFATGMNLALDGDVYFEANTTGKTIRMNSTIFPSNIDVYFNGVGGEWSFLDKFSAIGTTYLANGTINTNSNDVLWNQVRETGTSVMTLNLGASDVEITGSGFGWWVNNTLFNLNAGTSTIRFTHPTSPRMRFSPNQNFHNVIFEDPNATAEVTDNSNLSFNSLTFLGNAEVGLDGLSVNASNLTNSSFTIGTLVLSAGKTYTFQAGATQTITNFTALGTCSEFISLSSNNVGTQATFSKNTGTENAAFIQLQDMQRIGAGPISISDGVDQGNNTGWTILASGSRDLFWVGGTGNWTDENNWALCSGCAGPACPPSSIDNVFFDVNSFSSSSQTVTLDAASANCNNMTWSGITGSPNFNSGTTNALLIGGSLSLDPAMNLNLSGETYFNATSTGNTIQSAGHSFDGDVYFEGNGGEWNFVDAFTANDFLYMNSGTVNTNNQDVTWNNMRADGTANATMNLGSSTVDITGNGGFAFWQTNPNYTLNAGTSTIIFSGSSTSNPPAIRYIHNLVFHDVIFLGDAELEEITGSGNLSFNSTTFLGDALIMGSNNLGNLSLNGGQTYTFESGQTQFMTDFITNGSASNPVEIIATTLGIQSIFSMPTGGDDVCARHVFLRDNNATGGANWNAPSSSFNGNVTGWNVVDCFILNLDLTSLKAEAKKEYNLISWSVATNKLTGVFELEQSSDGFNWLSIDEQVIQYQLDYQAKDYAIAPLSYYRIKHIDAKGEVNYSAVVSLKRKATPSAIQVFPNPADSYIELNLKAGQYSKLYLINSLGQKVLEQKITTEQNRLYVDELPSGCYQLLLENTLNRSHHRLIIQH